MTNLHEPEVFEYDAEAMKLIIGVHCQGQLGDETGASVYDFMTNLAAD